MDEKAGGLDPLLPTGNRADTFKIASVDTRKKSRRTCLSYFVGILGVLSLIHLAFIHWLHNHEVPESEVPLNTPGKVERESGTLNYTRSELLHFDIESPPYAAIFDPVNIAESLNLCHFSWNVSGKLKLVRGDPEQRYNFMIGIDVAASSQMALDSVSWAMRSDESRLFIRCLDFADTTENKPYWNASAVVDVTVFVKPHTIQFGHFNLNLETLDIEIAQGLEFETYHMYLFSVRGNLVGFETDRFTAHEISLITQHGAITGDWSLPSSIAMRTGIVSWLVGGGPIDINLIPKRWSSGPTSHGALWASTMKGDISIRTPLVENMLSLRNMSIDVHTTLGSITGTFVTGIRTSLSTVAGSINATLLPDFALQDTSFIETSTSAGDTYLRVLPPIIDNYYQINPLLNCKSEHSAKGGSLHLNYPREWVGTALGLSETGCVTISGSRFHTVAQFDHLAVARTEDMIASRLDFSTTTGRGILRIE